MSRVNTLNRTRIALVASACLLAPVASPAFADAPASTAADCTSSGNVWVVVDMPDKTVAAGCATKPKNGLDALKQIGVEVTEVSGKDGMICELDKLPADACATDGYDAKTKSYWSYWSAPSPSGAWKFAEKGANENVPAAGTVEGWRWGDGSQQPRKAEAAIGQKAEETKDAAAEDKGMNQTTLWTIIGAAAAALIALGVWGMRRFRAKAAADRD